ncbi:MAG: serine/threonine protein kinase, partial [Micromonosporaceae bacterium]
ARVMATINHPGVVSVHDYGESSLEGGGSVAYLVMEYVEGQSLYHLLTQEGRIRPSRAMRLIAQAADALQAAHDRGIVHRDVKPGNLLVRPNGQLVLTDFGIARSAVSGNLTATGTVIGTASYVSPEQAVGDRDITPASDIYSLGVVAYQCLTGRRPFEGENPVQVALKHVRDEPPPLPGDIPASVRAVVTRAMAKDVATRWPDARAMADAASTAGEGGHVPAADHAPVPTLPQPTVDFSPGPDRPRYVPGRSAPPGGRDDVTSQTKGFDHLPGDHGDGDTYRQPPRKSSGKVIFGISAGLATVIMLVFAGPPLVNYLSSAGANPSPAANRQPNRHEPTVKIPNRALLQPQDLGPGYQPKVADPRGTLRVLFKQCTTGQWPHHKPVSDGNERGFTNPEDHDWVQYTKRYPGRQSGKYTAAVYQAISDCQKIAVSGVGNVRLVHIDHDFAGEASFLIREEHPGEDSFHVFVRQGDLVSMIMVDAEDATEDEARTVARKAAKRMCAATPAC